MRVVIALCSAVYSGRGETLLAPALRSIFIKEDGAISIHSDFGNKPLNYMGAGCSFIESTDFNTGEKIWTFETRKESLAITLHQIINDSHHKLDDIEPGLQRDGTEAHLQAWIAEHPHSLGAGYQTVQREYPTGAGPVDLLALDENGNKVCVEVKRTAMIGAVSQVKRYVDALNDLVEEGQPPVRGMIAALDIRPNTVKLAEKRGILLITLPKNYNKKSVSQKEDAV